MKFNKIILIIIIGMYCVTNANAEDYFSEITILNDIIKVKYETN